MIPNPALGVCFHWLGGLASGSFYVPYRWVKRWSWERSWLTGCVFSWILTPLIVGYSMTNDLFAVLKEAPGESIFWCYLFGVLWGFGHLTFGLTMRYLGMSLGMAVALGYCAAFGTLVPPVFRGEFIDKVVGTHSGIVILIGVAICLAGIAIAGMAGVSKERELSAEQKTAAIPEFHLRKGLIVATFSGVMSACFSYGLAAGEPIRLITLRHGTATLWQGLPVLVIVLLGGFTTNVIWCLTSIARNRAQHPETHSVASEPSPHRSKRVPLWFNYALCASAGVIWYLQFFFYTMGETQMGAYKFSSWTLHMASIMIFGSLWGLILKEWKGSGIRTMRLLALSLVALVASTVVVAYGNYLGSTTNLQSSVETTHIGNR